MTACVPLRETLCCWVPCLSPECSVLSGAIKLGLLGLEANSCGLGETLVSLDLVEPEELVDRRSLCSTSICYIFQDNWKHLRFPRTLE